VAALEWSIASLSDLDEIADFISSRNPGYGAIFVRRIVAAAEELTSFPLRGRRLPEQFPEEFRELIFQNYRIVYRLIGGRVVVLGVWHGAVDLEARLPGRPWDVS
jgi:plasmid stabilization system protein ParE